MTSPAGGWAFAIDVGGTFTDCVIRPPEGGERILKLPSSGVVKGRASRIAGTTLEDPARAGEPAGLWVGYRLVPIDALGRRGAAAQVAAFDPASGRLELSVPLADDDGPAYELDGGEEAPILAIRLALGLGLHQALPPVRVRLGTTRGTNALLTRTGARAALLVTRGLGDLLRIGTQERPKLFALAIDKPAPLYQRAIEIDERVGQDGEVLEPLDEPAARRALGELRADGIESLAICLLHGAAHPKHERRLAALAHAAGFVEVTVSSEVAPLPQIIPRAETCVLDAYLTPVLRRYLARIEHALGHAGELRLVTSAGGLVSPDRFSGKDSLLSGPAGGAVGYARAARAAGFVQAIGLDMGGTSTDVSRWAGELELEFETRKAGVRVVTPTLAIETVAAGGGSICSFDGVKLLVGPHSAGADPGPACYGRGGPLTITDMNLVLGRLAAERFPFPLDASAPRRLLEELAATIARTRGEPPLLPDELARGFVAIANAAMVRAIRAISVARGRDPADHVLVAFGAAAGQHACALARELGIHRVLSPARAGVLSAWGIANARVRRLHERPVLAPYSETALGALAPLWAELSARAEAEVRAEGVVPAHIARPRRFLDLRYRGQDAVIPIEQPGTGSFAEAFETAHQRRYGYRHAGRDLEIVCARVEVSGGEVDPPAPPPLPPLPEDAPVERAPPVVDASALQPHQMLSGPTLVCAADHTLWVEEGFVLRVLPEGDLLLEDRSGPPAAVAGTAASAEVDPVRLEIFNQQFASIAERMGAVLRRTASSTNVKERLDFSCALFTCEGQLVVNAPHIPVHLGAMSETVRQLVAAHPRPAPGDVFVTNDPYRGGSHLPDITVVTPVHAQAVGLAGTELLFILASRAHHADVGGIVPGSMPPGSRTLAEEGVLLGDELLCARGRLREEAIRAALAAGPYPARCPDDNLADLTAQVAANQAGIQGLRELCARQPLAVVLAYMDHIQAAAALKLRRALARLAPGRRRFVDHLDDGTPIAVTLTLAGETAIVDFAGTGPVLPGNLNANRAIVTAAVLYCFRCLIDEDIPLNAGVLAPLELRIPPGSLLDPPWPGDATRAPAMVGGNVETSQRLCDVLLGALGVAAASQGTMNNLGFGDASFGYYETVCGGSGATRESDGADAVHTHMTNTRLTDPEVLERRYPVRLRRFAVRAGSGGAGRHRGGDGVIRELEALRPLRVSLLSERRGPYPPYGLCGGQPGALGANWVHRRGATEPERLGSKVELELAPGDRLILETPGGGGFGDPPDA
jgi:5-oxoprolinase (ATP-hydrolysing)